MVVAVLFSVLLLVCTTGAQWESQTFSVNANNFGKCAWTGISSTSNMEPEPDKFHVVSYRATESERKEYEKLPETITKSNPKLGLGVVKGVPQADKWANNTKNSWQLSPDHPRNDKKNCVRVSKLTGESAVEIYDVYKKEVEFYVVRAVNALVHETGIVALPCGYFQPLEGCETMFKYVGRKWWNRCHDQFKATSTKWPEYWKSGQDDRLSTFNTTGCRDSFKGSVERYAKVFVITAAWDHNYHHFLIDSVSRLVRHLDFLIAHPDIRIHIRQYDQYAKESRADKGAQLRRNIAELLGLDPSRFVSGVVLADEVYLPRAVKCNYPIAHALEIRMLAQKLQQAAARRKISVEVANSFALNSPKKRVVLQHRPCSSDKDCALWRYWNSSVADSFAEMLGAHFLAHRVTVDNSNDPRIADCMACQVALYSRTNVLVGLHGAGLTNMIFMPPGSLVVEITGQFDGRMMPLCGYHGSLAAVFGLHHYVYYYDWKGGEKLDVAQIAAEAANFHRFLSK